MKTDLKHRKRFQALTLPAAAIVKDADPLPITVRCTCGERMQPLRKPDGGAVFPRVLVCSRRSPKRPFDPNATLAGCA